VRENDDTTKQRCHASLGSARTWDKQASMEAFRLQRCEWMLGRELGQIGQTESTLSYES